MPRYSIYSTDDAKLRKGAESQLATDYTTVDDVAPHVVPVLVHLF